MRAIKSILIAILLVTAIFSLSYAKDDNDLAVKELFSDPSKDSKVVFQIPIDVKLQEISEDANWYKVSIKFYIGPMEIKNTGWAYIPVGKILAQRETEKNKIANVVE